MIRNSVLTLVGVVAGYALMVVLITLVQETWFGGVSWDTTPIGTLAVAGFFTMLAAFVGAAAATAIVGGNTLVPAMIMALLVAVESTALVVSGRVAGPLWFDVLSALLLMFALISGGWAWNHFRELRTGTREKAA